MISDFPSILLFQLPITFILESGEKPSSENAGWFLMESKFTGMISGSN